MCVCAAMTVTSGREQGSAKKDVLMMLYSLCTVKENKLIRTMKAHIMKVLIKVMADFKLNTVDKSPTTTLASNAETCHNFSHLLECKRGKVISKVSWM